MPFSADNAPTQAFHRKKWLPVRNHSTTDTIPAHGLLAVYSVDIDPDNLTEVYVVGPPTTSCPAVAAAGPADIPPGMPGVATFDWPSVVLWDVASGSGETEGSGSGDGYPTACEEWGTEAGNHYLVYGASGFLILGGMRGDTVLATVAGGFGGAAFGSETITVVTDICMIEDFYDSGSGS